MCKLGAWSMLAVMCALVFALSGCGGGSLDGTASDNNSNTIPNNDPDTYDTGKVLAGQWSVLNDTINTINLERNDTTIQMRLISARMSLDNVSVDGNGGSLSVKDSRQEWYVLITRSDYQTNYVPYIDDDGVLRYMLEIEDVYSYDSDTVSSDINSSVLMTHSGRNKWRFEFVKDNGELNTKATAMNIEITSDTTMHVKQQDIVKVESYDVFYETEFDMRKVSSTN
ncbi:MAG: hypothetical protein IJQ08_10120 [Synergistaceae bacterium]|nr:hypothetical protein [Synergistaceae bacterium]